jgi:uncharacterized protein (TIGR03435 family)
MKMTQLRNTRKTCLGLVFVVAVLVGLAGVRARAQTTAAPSAGTQVGATASAVADPTMGIAFEVVSIRPTTPGFSKITNEATGDGITVEHSTLYEIIAWNYNMHSLRRDQLQGVPDWFTSIEDNYEIHAKVGEDDVVAWQKLSEGSRRLVFRKMLVDRFKLAWHNEQAEAPVYNLVVAKGGLKIKEAKPGEASPFQFHVAGDPGTPYKGAGITMRPAPGNDHMMWVMQQIHMSSFASSFLCEQSGRQVVDKTGLLGTYNFSLDFANPQMVAGRSGGGADEGPSLPDLFTAMQEQLGLKLEPGRGMVTHFVVDHVERPSEN